MNFFLTVFSKIFGNKGSNNEKNCQIDQELQKDDCNDDEMKNYINEFTVIYANILDYLEKNDNDEIESGNNIFFDQEILDDKSKLRFLLNIISKIADNHNRSFNLIQKIENIIRTMKNKIKSYFADDQIFNIFKTNKRLLYFLFKEKIIIPNKQIFDVISNNKNSIKYNNPLFFYPEFKSFFTDKLIKEHEINFIDLNEFEEKRKVGENDLYISQIIRDDLIDDFIIYITKNNIPLTSKINSSIFETNEFLLEKTPTILEYATFFGSIQIFQFIKLNNIKLTPSLWLYAIHGKNPEIIHLLEENGVFPYSYKLCLLESIKCHHNDIKDYFQNNYNNEINDSDTDFLIQSIKFHNYDVIPERFIKQTNIFYYLCKYDHYQIVKQLLANQNHEIDINWQREKQRNFKKYSFSKAKNPDNRYEKHYNDKKTPLIAAIENRNNEIVELLLQQKNIDVHLKYEMDFSIYSNGKYTNFEGENKKSILFIAAEKGYTEIVQLLLKRNDININEENVSNEDVVEKKLTALHIACTKGYLEIVKILLNDKKINVNCIEFYTKEYLIYKEKTPLVISIKNGYIEIFRLLLSQKETDINRIYYSYHRLFESPLCKFTPLQLAIEKENKEIVQILLETKNMNINEIGYKYKNHKSYSGTALHMAVMKNNFDIVQMLLSYDGIDVNIIANYTQSICRYTKINEEKTALFIAVENENYKIVELLLKNKRIDKNIELKITTKKQLDRFEKTESTSVLEIVKKARNTDIINILKYDI